MDAALADRLSQPLTLDNLGLVERDAPRRPAGRGAPATKAAEKVDPIRTTGCPPCSCSSCSS